MCPKDTDVQIEEDGSVSLPFDDLPSSSSDQSSCPTLPLQMEDHDVAGTSDTNTREAEVECPLLSRRKPIFRKKNLPLSATGKKIEPWVTAKTEVVQLQKRLLEKQLQEVEKRDEREEALFLIKKRSLELDVKIKEETLNNLKK
ncbi:uncharacterized protein [Anabrus simplex]|uniref:uncharacterized protein n=1 Tax=Anabrus simplex TaxID=316456 RepID=UPI0035A3AA85